MTDQEYEDKREAFDELRRKEIEMLEQLNNCNFEDERLFKEFVSVQQRRANLGRSLQID